MFKIYRAAQQQLKSDACALAEIPSVFNIAACPRVSAAARFIHINLVACRAREFGADPARSGVDLITTFKARRRFFLITGIFRAFAVRTAFRQKRRFKSLSALIDGGLLLRRLYLRDAALPAPRGFFVAARLNRAAPFAQNPNYLLKAALPRTPDAYADDSADADADDALLDFNRAPDRIIFFAQEDVPFGTRHAGFVLLSDYFATPYTSVLATKRCFYTFLTATEAQRHLLNQYSSAFALDDDSAFDEALFNEDEATVFDDTVLQTVRGALIAAARRNGNLRDSALFLNKRAAQYPADSDVVNMERVRFKPGYAAQ